MANLLSNRTDRPVNALSKARYLSLSIIAFGSLADPGKAAVLIEITESGSDLLFTTSGSLDTTGLGVPATASNDYAIWVGEIGVYAAISQGSQDSYGPEAFVGLTGQSTFSSAVMSDGPDVLLESGAADFAFRTGGNLWIPENYVSGTPVFQEMRWVGQSFAGLGINEGEFAELSWTAGADGGGGDSIRMQASPIPEPSSALLFGLAAFGFAARRRRR